MNQIKEVWVWKRSVQSQLISNYDINGNDLDKGVENDIIFLDFSKAFDKVPHDLLLHKPRRLALTTNFSTGLLTTCQKEANLLLLKANRQTCPSHLVYHKNLWTTSIYTLYVNDISDGCYSTASSFADDVKIFRQIKSTSDSDVLQNNLNLLEIWAKRLKTYFNVEKCKFMSISKAHCYMIFEY